MENDGGWYGEKRNLYEELVEAVYNRLDWEGILILSRCNARKNLVTDKEQWSMKNIRNEKNDFHRSNFHPEPVYYEITVQGELNQVWSEWFEGMALTYSEDREDGMIYTLVSGQVADQSALFGLLIKIHDLNLTIISVRQFIPGMNTDTGGIE